MQRWFFQLLLDLVLVVLATFGAVLWRDGADAWPSRMVDAVPYLALTLGVFLAVSILLGINRTSWALTSANDQLLVASAILLSVTGAVLGCFFYNRLDGVARGLPAIQALLMSVALIGARLLLHELRGRPERHRHRVFKRAKATGACETILVVGLNRLAELYLQGIDDLAPNRIAAVGLLSLDVGEKGQSVCGRRVLDSVERIHLVVRDLDVRGIAIDRIVVACPPEALSPAARAAFADLAANTTIAIDVISDWFAKRGPSEPNDRGAMAAADTVPEAERTADARLTEPVRFYWRVKRVLDIVLVLLASLLLAPVVLAVATAVAMDVGWPLLFWQQRPGRHGRPFRLYKFRTMGAAHDISGRRLPDHERSSAIGRFLRRSRLDELPQLYNVLVGHMSLVGPRPLLQADQVKAASARLLVRPGLTGWAQIKGGRKIAVEDKGALDLWYVRHASLALDMHILLQTPLTMLFGERVNAVAIGQAWCEISEFGCRPKECPLKNARIVSCRPRK